MTMRVYFMNFPRTEALEGLIMGRFEEVLERFFAGPRQSAFQAEVTVGTENSTAKQGGHAFSCELSLRSPRYHRLFVRKTARNFSEALAAAARGLSHALAHEKGRSLSRRHRRLRSSKRLRALLAAEAGER